MKPSFDPEEVRRIALAAAEEILPALSQEDFEGLSAEILAINRELTAQVAKLSGIESAKLDGPVLSITRAMHIDEELRKEIALDAIAQRGNSARRCLNPEQREKRNRIIGETIATNVLNELARYSRETNALHMYLDNLAELPSREERRTVLAHELTHRGQYNDTKGLIDYEKSLQDQVLDQESKRPRRKTSRASKAWHVLHTLIEGEADFIANKCVPGAVERIRQAAPAPRPRRLIDRVFRKRWERQTPHFMRTRGFAVWQSLDANVGFQRAREIVWTSYPTITKERDLARLGSQPRRTFLKGRSFPTRS